MTAPATLSEGRQAYPEPLRLAYASPPRAGNDAGRGGSRQTGTAAVPRKYVTTLLLAASWGTSFRNYSTYRYYEHLNPGAWMSFVKGTGPAPEQYRIGVKFLAWWIMRHAGGGFRHSFALLDTLASTATGLLLYGLLERSHFYEQAGHARQWLASAALLALLFYYLSWLPWFEKAETLPSAGFAAGLLWLWSAPAANVMHSRAHTRHRAWTATGLLLLTFAFALVRADLALLLNLGLCGVATQGRFSGGLSLPRPLAVTVSAACACVAAGTQACLMLVAFPEASYQGVPVFMLRHDFTDLAVVAPFVLFLLPFAWTVHAAVTCLRAAGANRPAHIELWKGDGAGLGILLGSLLYLPVWMALGKLDEVRIFLPCALALTPLSAKLLLQTLCPGPSNLVAAGPDAVLNRDLRRHAV